MNEFSALKAACSLSGIYEIVNTANGKRYIGSAVHFAKRRAAHVCDLRKNRHHSEHLQRAWNKYGPGAFAFRALLICAPENLLDYEQRAIDGFRPEYNICPKAGSPLGVKHSAETRAKMSAVQKDREFTPEHRARISAAQTGVKFTPERCALMSAAMLGKQNTPEQRAKISAALAGRKKTPEAIANMTAARRKRMAPR